MAFLFCETLLIPAIAKPLAPHNNKKWVVVIDAGHGGKDPGCHGLVYKEKDVALAVALKLGHLLQENDKNVKVIYTRSTDVFIPLNERANIANRNHADFFICIHCNASPDKTKFGSATYVMGLYKAEGNLEVSKRENASVLYEKDYKQTYSGFDPNSAEGNILFAMYQNAYLEQSLDLSSKIQKEYASKAARTDNGVKQAGFLVLWKTAMPSLLTEMGFLTNPEEETFLGSQKGQNKIAESLFFAMQQYIDQKEEITFNDTDLNLMPLQTDSFSEEETKAPLTDTSIKIVRVDTEKVKAVKSNPVPVKDVKNKTSKDAVKMKESLKVLHPDSSASIPAKKAADSTAKANRKRLADSTDSVLRKRSADSIVRVIKKRSADSAAKANRKRLADSTANALRKRSADSIAHVVKKRAADSTAKASVRRLDDSTKMVYKVQFLISPIVLLMSDARFKNIQDVEMYVDKSEYKYTSGHFVSLEEAVKLQSKLRDQGFKDAFIVAFKGKNRVPIVKNNK